MMLRYDHLMDRDFQFGKYDCFSLVRDFYADNFGIRITNYARPNEFWKHGLNLYIQFQEREGFQVIDFNPLTMRQGDVFVCAIMTAVPAHAAIHLGDGKVLHHLPKSNSSARHAGRPTVDPYKGLIRNSMCACLRHPSVNTEESLGEPVNLLAIAPKHIRRSLACMTS